MLFCSTQNSTLDHKCPARQEVWKICAQKEKKGYYAMFCKTKQKQKNDREVDPQKETDEDYKITSIKGPIAEQREIQ